MTVYQYRCRCTDHAWTDTGEGPHFAMERHHRLHAGGEWREKPAAEYLGDFGPNAMREAAMERVGELEAGGIASYYNADGSKPSFQDDLNRALRELCEVKDERIQTYAAGVDAFGDTPAERAKFPMFDGLLAYFPAALAWVSRCSFEGNQQHNAGQPMHWAMDKSTDHENKILRHLMAGFTDDKDRVPHSVKVAWRALARAQEDLMRRYGAPMPPNARRAHAERGNPVKQTDEE